MGKGALSGLDGFEQLDIGELYTIGSRVFVERGLTYYRQFAVESFEWDGRAKRLTALVMGGRNRAYEVWLQVCGGRLEHECDCSAWVKYGGCKHAIAATAAMFLAVQGKSVGGSQMPEDYAQQLRWELGYRDVGAAADLAKDPEGAAVPMPDTELLLTEISRYGDLQFQIVGPIPHDFLKSVGITLPNAYGFRVEREFTLGDPGSSLSAFLGTAEAQGLSVLVRMDGQSVPLKLMAGAARVDIQQHLSAHRVVRRLRFYRSSGEELEPYALIPGSPYLLLVDGTLCQLASSDALEEAAVDVGPLIVEDEVEGFNERSCQQVSKGMRVVPEALRFLVDGHAVEPSELGAESVGLELDVVAMENAAGECEALEFDCYVRVTEDLRVDLHQAIALLLEPVLHAYGGSLLSAKRRVQALCDLIRRIVAAGGTAEALDLDPYVEDYPELFDPAYRYGVVEVLHAVLQHLVATGDAPLTLAADPVARRWLAYPLELRNLAMLLYSLSDVSSRSDLQALLEGSIPVSRRLGPAEAVQRIVSVCGNLGVRVRYNAQPIRFEPLSISVATRAVGSEIDWFALHPSIQCGECSIGPDEWQQLIRGKLLLEDAQGGLVLPQVGMLRGGAWTHWPSCCVCARPPEKPSVATRWRRGCGYRAWKCWIGSCCAGTGCN